MSGMLPIDCLQAGKPSRERILEWGKGEVGGVLATLAIGEHAREASSPGAQGSRPFRDSFAPTPA